MNKLPKVRTRFAPSPTGFLTVGNFRTALFAWAWAAHNQGQFILRIEDTDKKREVEGSVDHILKNFEALDIKIDEGPVQGGPHAPYQQSKRLDLYQKYAKELIQKGVAYHCFCTPDRLTKMRADQAKKGIHPPRYDRLCLKLTPEEVEKRLKNKEQSVIRLKMPHDQTLSWDDAVLGKISFKGSDVDDTVLLKSDGFPTYHLAVVVDDHEMEISHAIRGLEWVSSTPKHLLIYEALGWTPPIFCHVPPIMAPGGRKKLSKRDGAKAFTDYLEEGYLPEALLNFVILIGWHPSDDQEILSREEIIKKFNLSGINRSGGIFDQKKLDFLNGYYLRQKTNEELVKLLKPHLPKLSPEALSALIPLLKNRLTLFTEAPNLCRFLWEKPDFKPQLLLQRQSNPQEVKEMLSQARETLNEADYSKPETLQRSLLDLIDKNSWNTGQFFMVFRVALTGQTATLPIVESLPILGKEKTLNYLTQALEKINLF